jgi:hypothetical protein
MWHKAQAQLSQGVAGQPCVGRFPKPVFNTCQSKMIRRVSNMGKAVQGENLAAQQSCMASQPVKWAPRAQSSATVLPYSSYKYHGAPPA